MEKTNVKYPILKAMALLVFTTILIGSPFVNAYESFNNKSGGDCGMAPCCCCADEMESDASDGCECRMDRQPEFPDFPEAVEYTPNPQGKLSGEKITVEAAGLIDADCNNTLDIFEIRLININSPPLFLINSSFLI